MIWGMADFSVADLVTEQRTINSKSFVKQTMTPLVGEISPGGRNLHAPRIPVDLDNYRVHFSKVTQDFLDPSNPLRVAQPPYDPDLAPSYLWLFRYLKIPSVDANSTNHTDF
jgi:hypothetical protein